MEVLELYRQCPPRRVTKHAVVYGIHFSAKEKSEFCGAIIDNRSYATICVLEEKDRKSKGAQKNMLRKIFDGICIVNFAFKVTANDSS